VWYIRLIFLPGVPFIIHKHVVGVETSASCGTHDDDEDDIRPPRFPLPPWDNVQSEDYDTYWKVVLKSKNLVVNYIPKVMCTSIRDAFNLKECNDTKSHCTQGKYSEQARTANVANMTRVVFLRDPFDRTLSAYRNSNENRWISVPGCSSRDECTFEKWVDIIAKDPKRAFRNNHTRPQVDIAQFDKMHYHYYLRVSSEIDQRFFWNDLVQSGPYHSNSASDASATVEEKMKTIKNETLHKIAQVYKQDMIMWERFLQRGTPRQAGEYTMYDYYREKLMKL
jgi:hypothetical protein